MDTNQLALDRAKCAAAQELAQQASVAARRAKTPEQRAAFSLLEMELSEMAQRSELLAAEEGLQS